MPPSYIFLLLALILGGTFAQAHIQGKEACHGVAIEGSDNLQAVCIAVKSLKLPHSFKEVKEKITSVTYKESNLTSLSLDDLADLPSLHTLTFSQCQISEWKVPEKESVPKVTTLILHGSWSSEYLRTPNGNGSLRFTANMFDGLRSLEHLHFVKCYMANMTQDIFGNITSLKKLHISDRCGIGCTNHPAMEWLLSWQAEGKAEISNDSVCFIPRDMRGGGGGILNMDTHYSMSEQYFFLIMKHRNVTAKHCPEKCQCIVEGYNGDRNKPIINTYCSLLGLKALPDVPPLSTRLDFSNNSITDISKLFTDVNYRTASSIRLENNQVSFLDGDLYSAFLKGRSQDLYMNLDNNNLTTLPVQQMLTVYKESQNSYGFAPFFTLGGNPWNCSDCSFLPGFQELVYHQYYYRDKGVKLYDNIRCAKGDGEVGFRRLITLDVESLCIPDPPLLQPIDILNICLSLLIILLTVNVAHSFYQYRHYSKLPWIISKVPCC